ncbi:MAG: YbhB/YbcL family Raf kinase inhibitor-like protein [Bacteroidota bacterium]
MANNTSGKLIISSPAFQQEGNIPSKYTCDGQEINPAFNIENIPDDTQTLAIVAEDPDASKGTFDHWVVWNIPKTGKIAENSTPGVSGKNGTGHTGYHGPCPPSGSHRYYFYVFALDTKLDLNAGSNKEELQAAMDEHILATGTLMGRYQKIKQNA